MSVFSTTSTIVGASSSSSATQNIGNLSVENDVEVTSAPHDSVSGLSFSPQAEFLAVSSWDNSQNVRIYEVGPNGQTQGKAAYDHNGPALSVCWSHDGLKVFSGGVDGAGRMFDVTTGQLQQVAQHDAPIKVVKWINSPQGGILATGSWDKTLRYWDLRSPTPIAGVNLPERVYSMDVMYPMLVVATADRHVQLFNLNNPTVPMKKVVSPLKWQTRVVSCFPDGYYLGSVEGRCAIQYYTEENRNFTFKCHRRDGPSKDQALVFPVNDISYHPIHGTFSTCGADGTITFWDGVARSRLKGYDPAPGPIACTTFNRNGTIFAYAMTYDWHKGHAGMTPGHVNKIMLHACKDEEVKKKVIPAK